jgi:ABC-type dipeptide/oligopeptide/nickel transport system ATPase subunit
MDVGIRAINALLTVGRGQRLGLFAGSGVGKSVLLGMMARYTAADRDRGRPDRRTRPRSEGVHRTEPRRRTACPLGGGRRPGRRAAR